jgi:hypothetical protein
VLSRPPHPTTFLCVVRHHKHEHDTCTTRHTRCNTGGVPWRSPRLRFRGGADRAGAGDRAAAAGALSPRPAGGAAAAGRRPAAARRPARTGAAPRGRGPSPAGTPTGPRARGTSTRLSVFFGICRVSGDLMARGVEFRWGAAPSGFAAWAHRRQRLA